MNSAILAFFLLTLGAAGILAGARILRRRPVSRDAERPSHRTFGKTGTW